jgi:hypothetical protein
MLSQPLCFLNFTSISGRVQSPLPLPTAVVGENAWFLLFRLCAHIDALSSYR